MREELTVFPASHYVTPQEQMDRALVGDRGASSRSASAARAARTAARSPAPAPAHQLRHGDDARDRDLRRHRELFASSQRARRRAAAVLPARLPSRRCAHRRRRVARGGPPDRRHEQGGPGSQDSVGGVRVPAPVRARQPAADLRRVGFDDRTDHLCECDARVHTRRHASQKVEQIIRPTGSSIPTIEVRSPPGRSTTLAQMRRRIERHERCLITTLTKKMAEDLTDYLREAGSKFDTCTGRSTRWSESRSSATCASAVDVLVGINLLREGLDLPEVSFIGILDADKEGYLRGYRSLIQTIGRAARNVFGHVVMYGDGCRTRWSTRSPRPTGAAQSRWPTTSSTTSRRCRS